MDQSNGSNGKLTAPPLGIPSPDGPTKAPDSMALQVMQLACKYLLYERSEETALSTAFAQVVDERHRNFHQKHVDGGGQLVPWTECTNQVCREAQDIIKDARRKEINIHPLAAELMSRYIVNFMPMPANMRLWLVHRDEAQLPATASEKREAGRVVLAS